MSEPEPQPERSSSQQQQQQKKKPVPWRNSKAKKLLRKDIIKGKCDGKGPQEVYKMRPEYKPYVYERFRDNLRALRAKIKEEQELAAFDMAALAHDLAIYPTPDASPHGYPRWAGSEAERKLKLAITEGTHKDMTPLHLHQSEPEFDEFPLRVFRNHLYQELRSRAERAYWKEYWAAHSRDD